MRIARTVIVEPPLQAPAESPLVRVSKRIHLPILFELILLALWAAWIGREYLDLNPLRVPAGREFGSAIASNHLWTQFAKCGWCAVWNGSQRGGYPAFADVQGSMLHPLVILGTLVFGVINGVKITLVLSLLMAGVAQWWIGREVGLGWPSRIWSAGIAIAGGHLTGRMDLGVYGVVLSTAAASLMFAALVRFAIKPTSRNAVLAGIFAASAILSGQGYIQIGLIGILPFYAIFFWNRIHPKQLLLAALIALLLSGPFLIPFLHYSPQITKWQDPSFESTQPLSYAVLNLVIDDPWYYYSGIMSKFPYPYLYTLYIGWVPMVLFLYALYHLPRSNRRIFLFMLAGAGCAFLQGSGFPFKFLSETWPQIAGIRHPAQIAGLAIPMILGISAYGLDHLMTAGWQSLATLFPGIIQRSMPLIKWLLFFPILYSLQSCMIFTMNWTKTLYLRDELFLLLEKLKTSDLQWVNPPFGEHIYVEPAIAMGMKLSPGILTWDWKDRTPPEAFIVAERKLPINYDSLLIEDISEIRIQKNETAAYAQVKTEKDVVPCVVSGSGGEIAVTCSTENKGILIVQENMFGGWNAWIDGRSTDLIGTDRLAVYAPRGTHEYRFRYIPWDVPLGLACYVVGMLLCLWLWMPVRRTIYQ
ncbi:MAG: hypothetical protein FJZ87_06220 [Chloroflexi bacterium]|nr:hypothetical protein [Chloroflexota bacterium]